jgi:hypothetical protein
LKVDDHTVNFVSRDLPLPFGDNNPSGGDKERLGWTQDTKGNRPRGFIVNQNRPVSSMFDEEGSGIFLCVTKGDTDNNSVESVASIPLH